MSLQRNQAQGYALAVDCLNARNFTKGIQHALQYVNLRPRDVRAHELLGQLYEGTKDWKRAIESYKTALQIDPQRSKLGLKVVSLYCQLPGEVERLRHWTDQVAKRYPDDPVIHQAQECIFRGTNQLDKFAEYIRKQLQKDPLNPVFTVKLLSCLQGQKKWSEALSQCDCILDVLHQDVNALQKVVSFNEKLLSGGGSLTADVIVRSSACLLVSLCYLAQAQLAGGSRMATKCIEVLARLSQKCSEVEPMLANLDTVMKFPCRKLYISEIRGQFHYLMGTYLLQSGLAGSLPIRDVLSKTGALYSLSLLEEAKQHNNLINLGWTLTPARILSRLSCGRVGQIWHFLQNVVQTHGESYLEECQRKWCSPESQKELFSGAFGAGHGGLSFLRGPSFLITNEPCRIGQDELTELLSGVFKINQESVTSDPENFQLLLWTCLQWDTREDNIPSDFGHFLEETFSNLNFSTSKLKVITIDNLRMLDLEAFLYAAVVVVRASLAARQGFQSRGSLEVNTKNLPLLTIRQQLTMKDQEEWFRAVYRLCHSKASTKEYSKLRVTAQRGLEVLRCGVNHGNETLLLVQLGRVMNARMMELKDTNGPGDRCRAYQAMSALYWTEAQGHLRKLANNTAVPVPAKPFFTHVHKDIEESDIVKYKDEGLVVLAEFSADGGDIHRGLRYLEDVKSPDGQFVRANLYKQLAREESVPDSEYQLTPTKLTTRGELLDKAKHALYSTMDGISQDANHPLHEKVRTLLVDIETEQDQVARKIAEVDGSSPPLVNESSVYHSFNGADTSLSGETSNGPSPQRLASEIRSLNFSQIQMERDREETKRLLDRTLDQNQNMMEQQAKLMEHILDMKQQPQRAPTPPPQQVPTPQGSAAALQLATLQGPAALGSGDLSVLNKIADQNERLHCVMTEMKDQFQELRKDVSDLKDKINKLELEQEKAKVRELELEKERGRIRELQKQVAAAAAVKSATQTPPGVPSPAPPQTGAGIMPPGHKASLYQQQPPGMYHHPSAAGVTGVTYIPHPTCPGYMIPVDSASFHSSMITSTPSVRRSIPPKTAPPMPGLGGLYDNGGSPTEEDEELKQQFVKGFGAGLGEPREYLDGSSQFPGQKGSGAGTPMRGLPSSWPSPSAGGSILAGTPGSLSPTKPLAGMQGHKFDAATALAAYANVAARRQQPPGTGLLANTSKPPVSSVPSAAANSLTVPKPIVTSVSTAKPSITQGHLIKSPTPANQALPPQTKPSEGPVQPSPFTGFSFKAASSGGPSGFVNNPAFQSPKSTPVTSAPASSPFAGFSFKPSTNQLDSGSGSGIGEGARGSATQSYPQLTALLSSDPSTPGEESGAGEARPGFQTPESAARKPGQSPMGLPGATATPLQRREDGGAARASDSGSDNDVILVGEKKATPEQIARAERLLLPPHFYLYEDKPPCPGCVGCDEEDLKARQAAAKPATSQGLGLFGAKPKEPAAASSGLFGGNVESPGLFSNSPVSGTSFASLSADGGASGFKKSDSTKPFAFAGEGALVIAAARPFGGNVESPGLFSNSPVSGISFASLSADGGASGFKKSDSTKPFAFAGAGAPVFGAARADTSDHAVEDSEYDPHYEPIIALPDKVEVVTGDEGEDVIFKERAKLYRWDAKLSAWKERGVGDMKILRNPETGQARILMRREQVLKVCANHRLTPDMKLEPMLSSDRAWVWLATDFAEEEVSHEKFAIKFKFAESAAEFKDAFERMKVAVIQEPGEKKKGGVESRSPRDEGQEEVSQEPPSTEDAIEHRFQAADPVVSHPEGGEKEGEDDDEEYDSEEDDDEYEYDEEEGYGDEEGDYDDNYDGPDRHGSTLPSLAEQFRPPAGSWTCDTCMVTNPGDKTQCLACETPKPGAEQPQTTGFSFGSSKPSGPLGATAGGPFTFKPQSGFPSTSSAFSAGPTPSFSFGEKSSSEAQGSGISSGGFKMPSAGFRFGSPQQPAATTESSFTAPMTSNTTAPGPFSFQSPTVNTNSNAASASDSTVADSNLRDKAGLGFTAVGKPDSQPNPSQSKFTFGDPMQQFSFGSPSQQKATSSGFSFGSPSGTPLAAGKSTGPVFGATPVKPGTTAARAFEGFSFAPKPEQKGDSKESPSTFAKGGQFSFRLDVGNVATSPPKSEGKAGAATPPVKSPGLNKSGEYYQSDERDDLHFEPVVTLPEVVNLETGEEGEEVKFNHRAKLYRWDTEGKQWKERGVGDIKVLRNPETKKHRIVMRRDQVLKVCANHFITDLVDLQPNAGSARSWVWHAMDVSEGEVSNEQLAVRFKTEDAATEFKEAVDAAKKES